MQDLTVDHHTLTVPLNWADPDGRTIDVHAAVVTRPGGADLPFLTFLQGGPGHEAPLRFVRRRRGSMRRWRSTAS
ncbi:hypothetical protein [Tessaracoccus coleopterorum]|uniref:hypothetical protein n=1 Tax=Tessaracoccus coleopterorum TaxID=2714950 RepID=UPI001E53B06B|nr:hypothetical protein [Tessaracoccus coleopterorum]